MEGQESEIRAALKRKFQEYFDANDDDFKQPVRNLYNGSDQLQNRRVPIQVDKLREYDPEALKNLLTNPSDSIPAIEDALREYAKTVADEGLLKALQRDDELFVGFSGNFGKNQLTPRELVSSYLNQLVKVYGIVTKCSLVRPKVVKSVHYCNESKAYHSREYRDVTSYTGAPTGAQYPVRDDEGRLLITEYGLCKYRDHQMITLQELPETAPPGQMPASTELILENDLVDACKPGDRVAIVGMYKTIAPKGSGMTSGVFKAVVVANTVEQLNREGKTNWSQPEMELIRDHAKNDKKLFERLAASLAPSIHGHDMIKRGLILLLMGGFERNLANGTHLRGDINCLMVGDPGVAKSQLLRAVMAVSPHAVSTTGRGSSGVGLTAAITSDSETGERRLEAGAMVLADRGVVCIDEFDKMSDADRVAIHEVMEQQTVTIAKAGVHTSLNARCSVLAAANPLYGSYDPTSPITKNINLPDSLLSRFDLLFIVRDNSTEEKDLALAQHVLGQHRYRPPGDDGKSAPYTASIHEMEDETLDEGVDGQLDPYVKYDVRLHGKRSQGTEHFDLFKPAFLRKFVAYVRRRYAVRGGTDFRISQEAQEEIVSFFTELRSSSADRALPVTARTLETIIRLSMAHCKLRLEWEVTADDVDAARSIMSSVLRTDEVDAEEHELLRRKHKPKSLLGNYDKKDVESRKRESEREGEEGAEREAKRQATDPAADVAAEAMAVDAPAAAPGPSTAAGPAPEVARGTLTDAQRKLVIDAIRETSDKNFNKHTPQELAAAVAAKGLVVALPVLEDFLKWVDGNQDKEEYRKLYLPRIFWDNTEKVYYCT